MMKAHKCDTNDPPTNLMQDGISTARLCAKSRTSLHPSVSSRIIRRERGVVDFNSLDATLSTPLRYLRNGLPIVAEHATTWRSGRADNNFSNM